MFLIVDLEVALRKRGEKDDGAGTSPPSLGEGEIPGVGCTEGVGGKTRTRASGLTTGADEGRGGSSGMSSGDEAIGSSGLMGMSVVVRGVGGASGVGGEGGSCDAIGSSGTAKKG